MFAAKKENGRLMDFILEARNSISTASIILDDNLSLGLYATDASLYQLRPLAVAIPANEADLAAIVKAAALYRIPILPRGSATSLAGQTTNEALVIDFTTYFNKILEINEIKKCARVQPGVVRDQLNAACATYGLHFAPDPATTSRATIGGMIANNSSGTKSILYGKTIDHVISLRVMLSDGTILELKEISQETWDQKVMLPGREGEIYRQFRTIIFEHHDAIISAYPKVMRRVQGYPLDSFVYTDQWNPAHLFCGSEGSLGLILEATVNLEPVPVHKAAITVHYADRLEAIREVPAMIPFQPAAVEMLDFNVFEQSIKHPLTKELHKRLITGAPQATLTVEFFCLSAEELEAKIQGFTSWLQSGSKAYAWPVLRTGRELDDAWSLRKNGLGLIMGDPAGRKPIPFIEDMAIPLEHLADYIAEVLDICARRGVETILYAHASVGVLHVRPALDLTLREDIELMKEISDEVFVLVKKYKGSWSGEHGDGRNRGHRLRDYFGEEVYGSLKEIKTLFDPHHLMNPHIIIDVPPMDMHLRYGDQYRDKKYDFVYHYRKDHSFEALVHNCSGVGACRNHKGGTMCPSFRATSEEKDSTRGRANALRLGISGQLGFNSLTDPAILDTLDLCLSCKACKSECPSNVDMAKLKSEVLQKKYDSGNIRLRERAIAMQPSMAASLSGFMAPIVNKVQQSTFFRFMAEKILGVDKRRVLPAYASESLTMWYDKNYVSRAERPKVALFADTYINYHEPHIGKAAIELLNACGYDVVLASVGCCQRPLISNGFLTKAKVQGTRVAEALMPYMQQGMHVLVCEPSCTSALTDDLPDLIDDQETAGMLQEKVMAIDVFLGKEMQAGRLRGHFHAKADNILLHGHCHQKSGAGIREMKSVYNGIEGLTATIPDSGCCGMAGAFGYEKEHYDLSMDIANLELAPAIRKASEGTLVVANGFSCRHQIQDACHQKAVHWVESITFTPSSEN